MAQVKLDTGFNIEIEFDIAPFHKRVMAWMVDLMICWLYVKIAALIVGTPSYFIYTYVWDLKGMLVSLPVLFYHLFFEVALNGKSPGKMAMNLQVITDSGGQPTTGQFLIRWVFRLIDFAFWIPLAVMYNTLPWWTMPITFAGLFAVIFTPKSQRIGDIVAGTILIDLKNRTSWEDTVFTEIAADYQPLYPQVMELSDRDINTLKSIIESVKKHNDENLALRISDRIQSKLNLNSTQQPYEFLVTLMKDYNYYSKGGKS